MNINKLKFTSRIALLLVISALVSGLNGQENGQEVQNEQVAEKPLVTNGTNQVQIGLTQEQRAGVGKILNQLLADEYALYVKTQNYHWNVSGPLFGQLHKMFNDQYVMLAKIIDQVAERALSLGIPAHATLAEFKQKTQLQEQPGLIPSANVMVKNLLEDHEAIIRTLRSDLVKTANEYNDMGTNNFLTDLLEKHEKTAWMLRSSLEK